ncbi:prepilin peptidase [Mangrovihabitans endophyticus]|uniref:Leader peptidase (Prepilin peptidase) / N-methyltransferase n=1 Tax=Mangrovihabitans endophyticus TaxID=1751298 RepID=A0A8J3FPK5_9ACTN|nr:prepilin peptidase [Mangrovihabitans endophyticus]GGK93640.1 hypothetical protein GCM10012284_29480 [Mangrovihabitans endophyticus]
MPLTLAVAAAVFGAAAAAFLPRITHRLAVPPGTPPLAACPDCDAPFPRGPSGWLRAGAGCACAGAPWRTVLCGAAVAVTLAVGWARSPALPALLVAGVLGLLLAEVDRRCLRLPDPLVAALAVVAGSAGLAGSAGRALAAAVLTGGGYLAVAVASGGRLGLGDVKLAAVLGWLLGSVSWSALGLGLGLAHAINGSVAVTVLTARRAGRDHRLPLGPALLTGALVALLVCGPAPIRAA